LLIIEFGTEHFCFRSVCICRHIWLQATQGRKHTNNYIRCCNFNVSFDSNILHIDYYDGAWLCAEI